MNHNPCFTNNDPEILTASLLDQWLDDLQTSIPWSRVTLIYDANYSNSFIPLLTPPEGKERILITSSGDNGTAYFCIDGNISFSSFFWSQVANGATVNDALAYAKLAISYFSRIDEISFSCFEQTPLIDANENGQIAFWGNPDVGVVHGVVPVMVQHGAAAPFALDHDPTQSVVSGKGWCVQDLVRGLLE